ncbi:hypothetical protein NQ317_013803 [Molorchus minor]|uniref:Protein aurora borealis n=1 Tax=Molorchus minor TaxID=1323400 RepID=A0ABQ9J4I1_9CUCU|nr:hypothetical protein NQ317_013803 [Molorchus minor]
MEFKYINDRNKTPNTKHKNKFSNTIGCDSPFRLLPNFSTPPSRLTKIFNPFESHLIDSLHLPTSSPSVFAKVSTPKTEVNFKWTIDDISSLKPADIDEGTISQHVFEEDPHVESIVQQKIDTFFSEKVIVPSPMTEVVRVPLIAHTLDGAINSPKQFSEGQLFYLTIVAFLFCPNNINTSPKLPDHLEEMLKPFYLFTQDQQSSDTDNVKDTSLYRKLFEFDQEPESPNECRSIESSSALSISLSPVQLSPLNGIDRSLEEPYDIPELRDCNLSPICGRSLRESRSACRLDFSGGMAMSIDASVVPDIGNQLSNQSAVFEDDRLPLQIDVLSDSTVNWDMEYKHVSLASANSSKDSERMDVCNSDTPHSKLFPSQRKRLSDSFRDDNYSKENKTHN